MNTAATGQLVCFKAADGSAVRWAAFPTSLGWMACRWRDDVLDANTFGHDFQAAALQSVQPDIAGRRGEPTDAMRDVIARLQMYARCGRDDFATVALNISATTKFQRRVLECCRAIPPGSTVTYASLAKKAGHPRAARAVGNVMRTNRFPLIVPCHRVVGSAGSLGGYSAPDGLDMKRRLLALEHCPLPTSTPRRAR